MPLGLAQETTLQLTLQAVDNASTAIRDVERSLTSLGAGVNLGNLGAQIGAVETAINKMAAVAPTVTDVEAGFLAVETAAKGTTTAVRDVEIALRDLGRGASLGDVLNQLNVLDHTMASVGHEVATLTAETQHGFKEMADAASYGTAAITDAIRTASVEQVEAVRNAMQQMTQATQRGMRQQASAARHSKGLLDKALDIGKQMTIWGLGYQIFNDVTSAVGRLAGGLVTVNDQLEQATATFGALYQNAAKGKEAVAWLDKFAEQVPASREEVIQAGMSVASLGDNVVEVLPALANISAIMHVDMPRAAQAFADAQMGRFQMLQMTLHVTKAELQNYGLELDKSGHVLNNSFVPAFEKLGNVRFAGAAAAQMNTFSGVVSNIGDAIARLQETMGHDLFHDITLGLHHFMDTLQRKDVENFSKRAGKALGTDFVGAVTLLIMAWKAVHPVITVVANIITTAAGKIADFMEKKVLPVVEQVLGQMSMWWKDHGKQVEDVIKFIVGVFMVFFGTIKSNLSSQLNILHGIWEIGWGMFIGTFGVFLDIITGNWKNLGTDLKQMLGNIAIGIIEIMAGMIERAVGILGHLEDPLTGLSSGFFKFASGVEEMFYNLWTNVKEYFVSGVNNLLITVNSGIDKINKLIPGTSHDIRHVGLMTFPVADDAALKQIRELANKRLVFQRTGDQAVDDIEKMKKQLSDDVRKFVGMPTSQRETRAGKSLWDHLVDEYNKTKKAFLTATTGKQDPLGKPDLSMPGGDTAVEDVKSTLQKAYDQAVKHLQADIARNLPEGVLMTDREQIHQIMLQQQKAGDKNVDDIFLELTSSLKEIQDHIAQQRKQAIDFLEGTLTLGLEQGRIRTPQQVMTNVNAQMALLRQQPLAPGETQAQHNLALTQTQNKLVKEGFDALIDVARRHFEFDSGPEGNAVLALKDENRVLALSVQEWKRMGLSPDDVSFNTRVLRAELEKTRQGSSYTRPAEPSYMPYGGLGRQPGFGGVEVQFGGPQADPNARLIATLREQLSVAREQIRHLQALLQPAQLTATNTGRIAGIFLPGYVPSPGPGHPAQAQPSVATIRRGGAMFSY